MSYIGLDLGTGAIKAVLWNKKEGIISKISERVEFARPAPNFVEMDANGYLAQFMSIVEKLAAASPDDIEGIAFAAASGNTLLCDKEGNALTPIISWLDARMGEEFFPQESWEVRKTTGWPALKTFPLMHLAYFKKTVPELLASSVVAMNNDYITWQLCGNHLLDSSNAAPFYMVEQETGKIAPYVKEYYGLTEDQLPRIVPPGTLAGTLLKKWQKGHLTAETRIHCGSFDHPAGARAAGIKEVGELLLSCGTSWVGFYPAAKREDVSMKELCDVFQSGSGGNWGGMFSLAKVGVEVEDFVVARYGNTPERYKLFNEEALSAGSAAYEKMKEVILRFKEKFDLHGPFTRIVISGGPSEGAAWKKYVEEFLGVPVTSSPYLSYTGAVGSAMLASGDEK